MKKFKYVLVERTYLHHEVEAESREDADAIVNDWINSGLIDWSNGDMECEYYFENETEVNHA